MSKRIDRYTLEVHEHLCVQGRSPSFWLDKARTHKHETGHGTTGNIPIFADDQFDIQSGERFEVVRERVSDDEIVVRIKRLKPNSKNKPQICPFSCKDVGRTKLRRQKIVHDPARYRSLQRLRRDRERSGKLPLVHVLLDDGRVVHSYICGNLTKIDGVGHVELDGFPFLHPVCRVFLPGKSPLKEAA